MAAYKTSVIIPVYNTEQYLEKCIQSVLNQTQKEVEIILVDDGSTDGSYGIMLSYAEQYSNVRVFHQENKKLGAARNLGMKYAVGKYVLFLDSDDYIKEKCLEELYNCAEANKLDFVTYDSDIFVEHMSEKKNCPTYDRSMLEIKRDKIYCGRDFLNTYYRIGGVFVSACLAYYNVEFLRRYRIFFEEQVYYEDNEFSLKVYYNADRMMYLAKKLYVRRYRENSIMMSKCETVHLQSALKMNEKCLQILFEISDVPENLEGIREIISVLADRVIKQLWEYKNEKDLFNNTYVQDLCVFFATCDEKVLLSNIGLGLAFSYYYIFSMIIENELLWNMIDVKELLRKRISLLKCRIEKAVNSLLIDLGLTEEKRLVIYGTGDVAERIITCCKAIYGELAGLKNKVIFANTKVASELKYMEKFPLVQIDDIEKYPVAAILIASTKYESEMRDSVNKLYGEKYICMAYREIANISICEERDI